MSDLLRNLLARVALSRPFFRPEWQAHIMTHLPILEPAFHHSPRGQLLTLRILDDLHRNQLTSRTKQRLDEMKAICVNGGSAPDKALFCVLYGLYYARRGNQDEMARCFRHANKYGHTYHMPHLALGLHDLYNRERYDDCMTEFDKAIDCIYKYPPLDESKRQAIAACHAAMACALVMMHRTDEAERMLAKAAAFPSSSEYHYTSALLHAIHGRRDEALKALADLKRSSESLYQHVEPGVQLILDRCHPHFTAKAPDPSAIAAYWSWFAGEERTLRRLISEGNGACVDYQRSHFNPLCPEPSNIDIIGVGFRMTNGQAELHFCAYYSRTYEALIDALIAACPPEVTAHWLITREP